jgi:hypothetical protein
VDGGGGGGDSFSQRTARWTGASSTAQHTARSRGKRQVMMLSSDHVAARQPAEPTRWGALAYGCRGRSIFGGIKAAAGSSAAVTYSLGSNMTCNNQEKGSTGQVDCVSDPSSKFHSAEAALAIQELVAAAKTAEVVVLAVGLGASLE